jgi:hypothetical protein
MAAEGILPAGLKVRRRAPKLAERLRAGDAKDPLSQLDWITVYAMAVNEENAAEERVVTAPTNGAAGVISRRGPLLSGVCRRSRRSVCVRASAGLKSNSSADRLWAYFAA